ncbi:MAG: DUF116 domain-containing protein [Bacillota bacterium]|jgi:hypothetical protein|nr:DUF116 domain-containing protein [Bacillota bacterium]MDD3298873.1 DUF116 domain-containing protein [Bacillota bacterium]MDD3850964.1 DUF116 domain-containing protein [Bacillota bacterium]
MYNEKSWAEDKGILTGLLALMLFVGLALAAAVVYLLIRQQRLFVRLAAVLLLVLTVAAVLVMTAALVSILILNSGHGGAAVSGKMVTGLLNAVLTPVMVFGRFVGLKRDRIQRAYANINNRVVYAGKPHFEPEDVLLLLPHCMQYSGCRHRITGDIYNCAECGRCKVADIVKLGRKTGVKIKMVPGGTLARKIIGEIRPKAVVAVACENDLCSGIRDTRKLPVIGVLNQRPHGPCRDTSVDVAEVKRAIEFFTNRRY